MTKVHSHVYDLSFLSAEETDYSNPAISFQIDIRLWEDICAKLNRRLESANHTDLVKGFSESDFSSPIAIFDLPQGNRFGYGHCCTGSIIDTKVKIDVLIKGKSHVNHAALMLMHLFAVFHERAEAATMVSNRIQELYLDFDISNIEATAFFL